jgi:GntR family transcriptional repressor for pyruvate dehydrogenase complex
MMPLQSVVHPGRKSLAIAEKLLERMRKGELLRGTKLPPERELAEIFKVSRTVVREALNALQMSGIVARHVGDGTYLAPGIDGAALRSFSLRDKLDASANVVEAIEAREALDSVVTGLAVENAKDVDLSVMDGIVLEMRDAIERQGIGQYLLLTLDLHIAIAKAGGNSILESVVVQLIDLIRPSLWIVERNYSKAIAESSFAIHKAIVDGIRARDRHLALDAVHKHYHEYPSLQR